MVLVIDIGNSHTVVGVYRGDELLYNWRLITDQQRTVDEYGAIMTSLISSAGIGSGAIEGICIACVVPAMVSMMERLGKRYFQKTPLIVSPGMDIGIKICYEKPEELGADRIVNAVAAYEKYRTALIVIDFGTATTFDCISPEGEFQGGAIAPGIAISAGVLFQKTSQLPRVDIIQPRSVIATNTAESIQSGIFIGYVSMVEGMITRISKEMQTEPKVVATGGFAPLLSRHTSAIDCVDENLILNGLNILYARNKNRSI